jgi:predicted transcriptional regulator
MTRDIYNTLLDTLGNPTKLGVLMLLSHTDKMTVTQMSKQMKVTKANLYHFVSQMVRDGLLSKPESQVKKNYVEKYYRVDPRFFAAVDTAEQKKRTKAATPAELKRILQSALISIGLDFRILAEEISNADNKVLSRLATFVAEDKVTLAYSIVHDKTYESILPELRRISKSMEEIEKGQEPALRGNRVIVIGLPRLESY